MWPKGVEFVNPTAFPGCGQLTEGFDLGAALQPWAHVGPLQEYIDWAIKQDHSDRRLQKLEEWAQAIRTAAMRNWHSAQAMKPLGELDGFPGFRQAVREAREHLVFLHDDRAPHGLFIVCKRWYQKEMAQYLEDTSVFEEDTRPWEEIATTLEAEIESFGFKAGRGIPYNYGIWKAKKQKFRYIAGTRSPPSAPGSENDRKRSGPPRSPTYFLCKALVKVLDRVGDSLHPVFG